MLLTEVIGVGRLDHTTGTDEAEFAVVINDAAQGKGLGRHMLERLIDVARTEKLNRITAEVHPENRNMLDLCKKLGFEIEFEIGDPTASVELALN